MTPVKKINEVFQSRVITANVIDHANSSNGFHFCLFFRCLSLKQVITCAVMSVRQDPGKTVLMSLQYKAKAQTLIKQGNQPGCSVGCKISDSDINSDFSKISDSDPIT